MNFAFSRTSHSPKSILPSTDILGFFNKPFSMQNYYFTQEICQKARFFLAWFFVVKILLQRHQFIPISIPPHKSILPITRYPESQVKSFQDPIRAQKHTQNTPYFAVFSIAWLLMVKIMLPQAQFIPVLTPLHMSIPLIPLDPDSHIWGRLGPHQSTETTLKTPNSAAFSIA